LSYVGEPFEYDIFVSYAHAEVETQAPDVRLWCRHVAERLRNRLASALNIDDFGLGVRVFLDDRVLRTGEPLTETLRDKVQRSALLLVLMSPLYPKKGWCLDELEWFFEQADKDGRSQQHCTVLRIQPLPDAAWPKRLLDQRGKPVLFRDLADSDASLPIGFDNYDLPALKDAIRGVQIELISKLKELRVQLENRRHYQRAAVPPVRPVVYLQARKQDLPDWEITRVALEPHAIVNPDSLPEAIGDDALLQLQRETRLKEYAECDGLVLLRADTDETFRIDVMAAYKDRQRLFQQQRRNIPWAIVDRRGDAPSVYSAYHVPCVAASNPDWPRRLVGTLGFETSRSS
jgi:hypothetical protein